MNPPQVYEAEKKESLENAYVLIYDDECNVCKRSRQMLAEHELRESIVTLGAHTALAQEMYADFPIGKKLVLVSPDGSVVVGGEALIQCMCLTKKYHRLASVLGRFSGTRWAVEIAWRCIARNRMLLSKTVKCNDACGF
ncbi:MAG TPA: DCC1-like thiol-disulfide oxidoreductase family protein [Acidimicrobiia bacterium]|nr:DCC1-like thiol-disulfide oxidoreductase family protein [Acidimicrobiia bacterium]